MKAKKPHKGMPANLYITLDGHEFRQVDPSKWLHPLTMQRYVRADLYDKARAEIKRLRQQLEWQPIEETRQMYPDERFKSCTVFIEEADPACHELQHDIENALFERGYDVSVETEW